MSLLMGTKASQLTPGASRLSHVACAPTSELVGGGRTSEAVRLEAPRELAHGSQSFSANTGR